MLRIQIVLICAKLQKRSVVNMNADAIFAMYVLIFTSDIATFKAV